MKKISLGLLPLYLKLYDGICPERHKEMEAFAGTIRKSFENAGIKVTPAPVCRIKQEFAKAVKTFEDSHVDAIVTLHLAYSPSLESVDILAKSHLPLIMLDTTPDFDFGFNTDPSRIMFNHGIHGVQDLCNMLLRKGKPFLLEAGHWQKSDVLTRVVHDIKACVAANAMKTARVGIIGKPFKGMGDFALPFAELKKLIGFEVIQAKPADFERSRPEISHVKNEIKSYHKLFKFGKIPEKSLMKTVETSLCIRRWIEEKKLSAFTFNFLDIDKKCGLETVPFLEASLAMSRGIGYAGEGDALTAAFVSSLMKIFPESTFAEMFCPDWKGNKIFLSHMGEVNTSLVNGKAELLEKNAPFIKSESAPVFAQGCLKAGKAALFNLAPGPENTFKLIASSGNIRSPRKSTMPGISGWFEPEIPLKEFLMKYSLHGGTHHSALVYNPDLEITAKYAAIMNWKFAMC